MPDGRVSTLWRAQDTVALRSASTTERDDAWRALYDEHFPQVFQLVARFGVVPAEVEDVTQQVFLIAYRRLSEVEDVLNMRAWLRGIAARVVSDHHRWRRVRRVKQWLVESTFGDGGREQV